MVFILRIRLLRPPTLAPVGLGFPGGCFLNQDNGYHELVEDVGGVAAPEDAGGDAEDALVVAGAEDALVVAGAEGGGGCVEFIYYY